MEFRLQLDQQYDGPIDLLLYLVRKEELPIAEVPLASVTQQFLDYVALLERLEIDSIGEFLDVASQLIELKSRVVLPQHEEIEQELEDPRKDLVERLLQFKQYRDAASLLEQRGVEWRRRHARKAKDLPPRTFNLADQPIHSVELWDLVSAFGRVMRDRLEPEEPESIRYDETPLHVHMERIYGHLTTASEVLFSKLFPEIVHKSTLVGTFLAVLELVRHRHAIVEQATPCSDIVMRRGPDPLPEDIERRVDASPRG